MAYRLLKQLYWTALFLCLLEITVKAGITWTGAINGNWDSTTANWTGDSTTFTDNGTIDVTFNDAAGGTITISPNMSPASTTVSAGSGTYVFSGGPIDSGSFIKSGNGTLQLTSANTFPGGFTLNGGKVEGAHLTDVFGGGTITFNAGELTGIGNAAGSFTNAIMINGSFSKGHNAGLTLSGPVTLGSSSTITNHRNSITLSGMITDGGNGYGLTFDSTRSDAEARLSNGANSYSGKTIIKASGVAGLLKNAGVASGFGAPTGTNAVIDLFNGAKLGIFSGSSSDRIIDLVGIGVGTVTVSVDVNGGGTIGSFAASGTGSKTLKFLDSFFYGSDPGWITVNGTIPDISDGSPLSLDVPFSSNNSGNALTLNGTNLFSGPISIGGIRTGLFTIGGAGMLGNGYFTNMITIGSGSTFDYASSATQELSGAVSGGGILKISGSGALTLSSSNTYAGGTLINNGVLFAGALGALSTGDVTVAGSGQLVMTEENAMSSSATLNLPDNVTETVIMNTRGCEIGALVINSVAQPNGIYSSSGNAWLGGTGKLFVGVPATPKGTLVFLD